VRTALLHLGEQSCVETCSSVDQRRLTAAISGNNPNKVLDWASRIWNATQPLRIVVGVALLGVSVLIVVSFLIGYDVFHSPFDWVVPRCSVVTACAR